MWTDEEIRQMMQKVMPKSGAEIAALLDEMEAGFGDRDGIETSNT